jgi:hypothetical protein
MAMTMTMTITSIKTTIKGKQIPRGIIPRETKITATIKTRSKAREEKAKDPLISPVKLGSKSVPPIRSSFIQDIMREEMKYPCREIPPLIG